MKATRKGAAESRVDPWVMLGALSAILDLKEKITVTDWNEAVELSAKARVEFERVMQERTP